MCRYPVKGLSYDSSNTKAFLLLQAHFSRLPLPCADYYTDLKSVLDQSIRILQAMIDVVAERGFLSSTLQIIQLLQMILQGRWIDESSLLTLPFVEKAHLPLFSNLSMCLPLFCASATNSSSQATKILMQGMNESYTKKIIKVAADMPILSNNLHLQSDSKTDKAKKIEISCKNNSIPLMLIKDQEYTLTIETKRKNYSKTLKAHCPRFHRVKDEGWFLVLGDIERRELLALKRVSGIHGARKTHLQFTVSFCGSTKLALYVMSDCYIALDQQYNILIHVTEI